MKVAIYNYAVLLSCLRAASVVASTSFSHDICPSWYLRQGKFDNRQDPVVELTATCFTGNTTSNEYRTSRLDLDPCFTNHNGDLEAAVSGSSNEPGRFTRTCSACALDLEGPDGDDGKTWHVFLRCICAKHMGLGWGSVQIEKGINVNDGILGCMNYPGSEVPYSSNANPAMLPPPGTTTLTTTATANNTVTVTNISTAVSNATIFNTATQTAISTVISSCQSPSPVTVTKTRKGKAHKVTATTTMVETHPVTVLVSIMVTPTPKPTIDAQLHSTVVADFTTINK
ncbi:uncharacterized protein GGS22DRAFT_198633 [Annulohypoxylon maeteangense]|uniref:uncharacterized protein n=1 Tax=Annulohypoxylon maeteangense TaxID=1927788 RepID=UPI002008B89A|nr:uncharacterized protein GGS22DRAFT_198633 [Annulohypoxylon maeteangense]KAI0887265.1 hypothetical protein GGS22DRAFT_198633 [Annulohypoxylon maeteangense]